MRKGGIVCDSACDLEPSWLAEHDVVLVPLRVLFGEDEHLDWIDLRPEEFFERLAASEKLPTTSQPSSADFAAAYEQLAEAGCDGIVSVHLTSALSGTCEPAVLAAKESPVPVEVVDSKLVSQALGLVVKRAIELRDAGLSHTGIAAIMREVAASTRLFFVLDALEYLVRGGRAARAQGLAASVLNIKPVLRFDAEGTIEPFKKVKGTRKALAELAAHVADESKRFGRVRVAVLHACDPALATEILAAVDTAGVDYEYDSTGLAGSVIGTYSGKSAVGMGYYPIG